MSAWLRNLNFLRKQWGTVQCLWVGQCFATAHREEGSNWVPEYGSSGYSCQLDGMEITRPHWDRRGWKECISACPVPQGFSLVHQPDETIQDFLYHGLCLDLETPSFSSFSLPHFCYLLKDENINVWKKQSRKDS